MFLITYALSNILEMVGGVNGSGICASAEKNNREYNNF